MATTPPAPDATKFQNIIAIIDNAQVYSRDLVDAIKKPNGKAVARYKDLHVLALQFKDAVNGLYAAASAADKSLQTGKRKEKAQNNDKDSEKDNAPADEGLSDKGKQIHKDNDRKAARAEKRQRDDADRRAPRASREPEPTVTEAGSDEP